MQKIKSLSVTFSEPISPRELTCFRGAIVEKVGRQHDQYHNHQTGDAGGFHYRYPLIQYKLWRKRPMIVFINEAIDDARHFFTQPDWDMTMASRPYKVQIEQLKARELSFGQLPKQKEYRIRRWLALNSKNFAAYQNLPDMQAKLAKLEQLLANSIIAMAKAFDYRFTERFTVKITDFESKYQVRYKNTNLLAFDLTFRTDVQLPYNLALGKGGSLGYGFVRLAGVTPSITQPAETTMIAL